ACELVAREAGVVVADVPGVVEVDAPVGGRVRTDPGSEVGGRLLRQGVPGGAQLGEERGELGRGCLERQDGADQVAQHRRDLDAVGQGRLTEPPGLDATPRDRLAQRILGLPPAGPSRSTSACPIGLPSLVYIRPCCTAARYGLSRDSQIARTVPWVAT